MKLVATILVGSLALTEGFVQNHGFARISQNFAYKGRQASLLMAESSQISMPALSSTMTEGKYVPKSNLVQKFKACN